MTVNFELHGKRNKYNINAARKREWDEDKGRWELVAKSVELRDLVGSLIFVMRTYSMYASMVAKTRKKMVGLATYSFRLAHNKYFKKRPELTECLRWVDWAGWAPWSTMVGHKWNLGAYLWGWFTAWEGQTHRKRNATLQKYNGKTKHRKRSNSKRRDWQNTRNTNIFYTYIR